MKAVTKITFYDEQDEKFFGEGPCRLLHAPWDLLTPKRFV